jgi:hypothetical protein
LKGKESQINRSFKEARLKRIKKSGIKFAKEDVMSCRIHRHLTFALIGMIVILISSCSHTVRVLIPPRIELKNYETVGLIQFSSNAKGSLQPFVTQKFLQSVQSAQPGIRVLELGTESAVLESVQHSQVDIEAVKAIGQKYNVKGLIAGNLKVTDVKPKLQVLSIIKSMGVQAEIQAALTVRLFETQSGATVWTRSSNDRRTVGHVSLTGDIIDFSAKDPEEAYGELAKSLVYRITDDFWSHWERQQIK